jgi:hypothetical protein
VNQCHVCYTFHQIVFHSMISDHHRKPCYQRNQQTFAELTNILKDYGKLESNFISESLHANFVKNSEFRIEGTMEIGL